MPGFVDCWNLLSSKGYKERGGEPVLGEADRSFIENRIQEQVRAGYTPIEAAKMAVQKHLDQASEQLGSIYEQAGVKPPEPVKPEAPAEPERITSIKNKVVDEERAARGEEPLMEPARKANPETWDEGMKIIEKDETIGERMVDDLLSGRKKTGSETDEAILYHEKIRVMNERDKVGDRASDPNLSEPERAAAQERWTQLEERVNEVDLATQAIGTISGRMQQFRQVMAKNDFTLAAMERQARVAKGGPLSPTEQTKAAAMQRKISAARKTADEIREAYNKKRQANIEKRIAELGELKQAGKFKRDRKPLPEKSPETLKAEGRLLGAENEFRAWVHELKLKSQPWYQKGGRLLQQVRGFILGGDVGMLGRQGLFAWSRPITAIKATANALKATFSPEYMDRWSVGIRDKIVNGKPALPARKVAGLQTTDTLIHPEELVITRLLSRLPDITVGGKTIRLSTLGRALERFQTTFINSVRTDLFDKALRRGYTPEELRQRANFINSSTGRGNAKHVPNWLSTIMTSPRYEMSRWEMISQPIRNVGRLAMDGVTKGTLNRGAWANLQDMVVTAAEVYGLFKLAEVAGGYSVNWNPTSSDFLKMRKGNDVWDVSAGLAPRLRDLMRMYVALTNPSYRDNLGKTIAGTGMRTINPAIRLGLEQGSLAAQRAQGISEPKLPFDGFKAPEEEAGLILMAPLVYQSFNRALIDGGMGDAEWAGVREFVGTSVSRYPEPEEKAGSRSGRSGRHGR